MWVLAISFYLINNNIKQCLQAPLTNTTQTTTIKRLQNQPGHDQTDSVPTAISKSSASKKSWGPIALVEVHREAPGVGLGISIVGGKVESRGLQDYYLSDTGYSKGVHPEVDGVISGIFIKNVMPDSPAGRTGQLFTGDHLLQVNETKLTSSDQDLAAQAIQNAGNPVKLKIRSLIMQVNIPILYYLSS